MREADFTGANLKDAIFFASVLDSTIFERAKIKNTDVTASVADNIVFSANQEEELRRSPSPSFFPEIKIWSFARESNYWDATRPAYSTSYSSYSNSGFANIPLLSRGNLASRKPSSLSPVGPLRNFEKYGYNYIRAYHWFDQKFWNMANHGNQIRKRLDSLIDLIYQEVSQQKLIEGNGSERKEIMVYMEEAAKEVEYKDPLMLNKDAHNTVLLAKKLIPEEEVDWPSLAFLRCRIDKNYRSDIHYDSWKPLYPAGTICSLFPVNHEDLYKKWSYKRADNLKAKELRITNEFQYYQLRGLQELENGEDSSRKKLLIFKKKSRVSEFLDRNMNPGGVDKSGLHNFLGVSGVPKVLVELPLRKDNYYIEVDTKDWLNEYNNKHVTVYQIFLDFKLKEVSKNDKDQWIYK
ncbi:MAG: pentapeptide repeat-containing protein, partial [Bacteroidota bacterium]